MNTAVDDIETATASSASAARALEALAAELPHFEGRAMNLGGASGGTCAPGADLAQKVRRRIAREAMQRLGAMWHRGERDEVFALWLAYVRGGAEGRARAAKRAGAWFEELGYLLLPVAELGRALRGASRKGAGPDAAAARVRGAAVLQRAEVTYADTDPTDTDGTWLAVVRAAVDARAVSYRELVEVVAEERAAARRRAQALRDGKPSAAAPAAEEPAPAAEEPAPLMGIDEAVAVVGRLGFAGAALRARMALALVAGDVETVRCEAVDRGLDTTALDGLVGEVSAA